MAYGPGKYSALCSQAMLDAKAVACVLVTLGGEHGSGFEVVGQPGVVLDIPAILREMADSIERDEKKVKEQ
jgi:hypothetical protein